MSLSRDQVLELAPDDQVRRAGSRLAGSGQWAALGSDDRAVWGEIRGSGKRPYRAGIDLQGPAFRCSCPSRKFPCKHGLGLMLTFAKEAKAFSSRGAPPPWVAEWLAGRDARAKVRAALPPPRKKRVPDAKARASRARQREARIAAGLDELEIWLRDVLRQGLAAWQASPDRPWDGMAARLVDAQAPGLARRVSALGGLLHSGPGWESRVLRAIGRLALLVAAYRRQAHLDDALRAEIRSAIGWTTSESDLEDRPGTKDVWQVVGQRIEEEERLTVRRTWLWGGRTERFALLLDFAPRGRTLEAGLAPGQAFAGELVFYPGALPLRARVRARVPAPKQPTPPDGRRVGEALADYGDALARVPWFESLPLYVTGVVPVPVTENEKTRWWLVDDDDLALEVEPACELAWEMLAVSGGRPIAAFGEWNGERLTVLAYRSVEAPAA